MRLAKPIYNKNGVLLFDRDTKLTVPGINNIENFQLIGVYILEPAEPLPPLSEEDIAFEQNQTVYLFRLRDVFQNIADRKLPEGLPSIVSDIRRNYGALDHRVNFNQNIRSAEDFLYKHGISTAILTAMISSRITMIGRNRDALVCAALLYGFGYRSVPASILEKGNEVTDEDQTVIQHHLEEGYRFLMPYQEQFDFFPQALRLMGHYIYSRNPEANLKPDTSLSLMEAVLKVADRFDRLTAMNLGHEPESEIMAMKHLYKDSKNYPAPIVKILSECIHIVPRAASVDLSTGDPGIILVENPTDYLHPVVLRLKNNKVYDLSIPSVASEIQIKDIMKTMDNRVHMDEDTLKQFVPDERLKRILRRMREQSSSV